jgi:hypothetical protein
MNGGLIKIARMLWYVRYGLRDVQTTWECFDHLARRFASFGLNETGLYELYSEASLGKAYLRAMGIKPWQEVQRGFPLHLVGAIMSAYFGGRAEVHIRRQITPVVHTDFLSMYPTVCTLMGLWSFVRAKGMTHHDNTNAVTALVARPREELVEHLRKKDGWKDLASLVQVRPRNNLFLGYLTPTAYAANLSATCDRLRNPDQLRRSHVAPPAPNGVKPDLLPENWAVWS